MCSGLSQGTFDFINIFKAFSGGGGGITPTPTHSPTPSPTPTMTQTPTATPPSGAQPWNGNFHPYAVGDLVTFQGHTYRCIQAHTSQPTWDPVTVPALWQF